MQGIEYIPLTRDNLDIARDIYNYYAVHTTATFHIYPLSPDEFLSMIPLGHSKYKSFLIYQDKKVTGYCYIGQYKKRGAYDRTAEVTIYLKPGYTGKGLGLTSLKYLEEVAQVEGIQVLLGIVSGDNKASIRLFKNAGYQKCAHFRQVGEKFGKILDVIAFEKILAAP